MEQIKSLGDGIYQIDIMENGIPFRTTAYLIQADKTILIETGASPSNQPIHNALKKLNISPSEIDAILVTHIHLDHSGGAGLLMSQCPNATLFAHPMGRPHLINPEKLVQGARIVYGKNFDKFFDPILPIPESRVRVYEEGDEFELAPDRKLKIYSSPGHALHQVFIHDPLTNGIFTGDSAGVFYEPVHQKHKVKFSMPSTSPTQFDPESMKKSLQKMITLAPDRIYYTHYGMVEPALPQLKMVLDLVPLFGDTCVKQYQKERSVTSLTNLIRKELEEQLEKIGVPKDCETHHSMDLDIELNAQGVAAFVSRQERS